MSEDLTSEAKLKAVIEAQGHTGYLGKLPPSDDGELADILFILLNTKGTKAAYGFVIVRISEDGVKEKKPYFIMFMMSQGSGKTEGYLQEEMPAYRYAGIRILLAYNSGPGNNWKAAIDVAYSLLPKP